MGGGVLAGRVGDTSCRVPGPTDQGLPCVCGPRDGRLWPLQEPLIHSRILAVRCRPSPALCFLVPVGGSGGGDDRYVGTLQFCFAVKLSAGCGASNEPIDWSTARQHHLLSFVGAFWFCTHPSADYAEVAAACCLVEATAASLSYARCCMLCSPPDPRFPARRSCRWWSAPVLL